MRRAGKVSSGTAIAAAMDVSLNKEMNVLPSAGSTLRTITGVTTWSAMPKRVRPIALPASTSPFGTEISPARNTSTR